nr:hypothetical protein [Streptomyces sp. NRRL S-1448]
MDAEGIHHALRVTDDDERLIAGPAAGVEHRAVRQPHEVFGVPGAAVDLYLSHDPRVGEALAQPVRLGEKRHVAAVIDECRVGDRHEVSPRPHLHHVQFGPGGDREGVALLAGAEVFDHVIDGVERPGEFGGLGGVVGRQVGRVDVERREEDGQFVPGAAAGGGAIGGHGPERVVGHEAHGSGVTIRPAAGSLPPGDAGPVAGFGGTAGGGGECTYGRPGQPLEIGFG